MAYAQNKTFYAAVLLSATAVMPINIILPSLANISEDLGASYADIAVTVPIFAIVAACSQLVAGPISDWIGRRNVVIAALVAYVFSSIICAITVSATTFVIARSIQAVIIVGYGIAVAVVKDTSSDERLASNLSYMATAWSIVPIIGPSIGGVIDQAAGWRSIFICLTIVGIGVGAYALPLIPSRKSTSLGLAEYIRSYLNLLTSRKYLLSVSTMALCLGALYVYLGHVTAVLRTEAISNNIVTGIVVSAAPLGFFGGSFISGSMSKTRSRGFNMVVGRVLVLTGMIVSLGLAVPNIGGVIPVALAGLFTGLGNGITLPNASSMAISVNKELTGAAVGLASAISLGFGGVIAFACGLFIQDRLNDVALLGTLLVVSAVSMIATWIAVKAE